LSSFVGDKSLLCSKLILKKIFYAQIVQKWGVKMKEAIAPHIPITVLFYDKFCRAFYDPKIKKSDKVALSQQKVNWRLRAAIIGYPNDKTEFYRVVQDEKMLLKLENK
jgi:hypothetical protein